MAVQREREHRHHKAEWQGSSEIEFTLKAEYFMGGVLRVCVCIIPCVNGDDLDERVLPDLGQVQSCATEPPASIFLLTQQTN